MDNSNFTPDDPSSVSQASPTGHGSSDWVESEEAKYTRFALTEDGESSARINGLSRVKHGSQYGDRLGEVEDGNIGAEEDLAGREIFRRASDFYSYDPEEHEVQEQLGFSDPSNPPQPGCNITYIQWRTRRFVEHFIFRLLTAVLIIVDMVILIIDLTKGNINPTDPLELTALALSTYFMAEIVLRIFGLGFKLFFRVWYNSLDCALVVITFMLSIIAVSVESMQSNPVSLIVVLRLVRLVRISRIVWQQKHLTKGARQFISQNKRRYQREGFDLDLSYVTPTVIAMSFPSSGKMSMYRNDIRDVSRFLDYKHAGHYRVYNLCSERHYDEHFFHGAVQRYPINDHNVPAIEVMLEFSENVRKFQAEDERNVIAVHCKGGKGRTGTMICVCLIDSGAFKNADQCLSYFGDRRTDKNAGSKFQGVETPSQSRYVGYYERVVRNGRQIPPSVVLVLKRFVMHGMKGVGLGTGEEFTITVGSRTSALPYRCSLTSIQHCKRRVSKGEVYVDLLPGPQVSGDTKVVFYSSSRHVPKGYDNCPFFFWFHSGFIENNKLTLTRGELDNPHKSKTWNVFKANFGITLYFEPLQAEDP
ncbi:phosphatidylinositol 3,4,5-trisphosphate 3-phosphatase TPTE2 isoform X1 [Hyalella azteca]|uniref:Phosphatidylinositol 3,4,5-trisphosphate 3-phosphatase TPTE2 isoform X1 n=1 Tax=Hyalella azteca TaxID=294128 RepID=A0A8B7MZE6_HYAAZ|nr:phosphatidylinositol 3,4,5-trisphosphate 3-phosphatase TPTE2 isoform X1 [Hyalella azteca]